MGVKVAGSNGLNTCVLVLPLFVTVKLLKLLSTNLGDWQVNKLVFVIAVSGVVLGVKFAVYTAVPLT